MNELNMEWVPIEQINPSPYNPRKTLKPSDIEYRKLKQSMKQFGYVDPLIWNQRTGNLVGGHQRFSILKEEGVKQIQVSVVDLDEQQEKALNLALNKISGHWDESLLSSIIAELDEDLLQITGFDHKEIDQLLKNHEANMKTEFLASFIESQEESKTHSSLKDAPPQNSLPLSFSVTPDERAIVLGAIQQAKIEWNLPNSNKALVQICRSYYTGELS